MFNTINIPKSVLTSNKPKDRRCDSCPRWHSLCKNVYDDLGELPKIESCPIWNGQYDTDSKLWYYQDESEVVQENKNVLEDKVKLSAKIIGERLNPNVTYQIVDENNFAIFIDYTDVDLGIIPLYIEKRKLDVLVHDDEFLYDLLEKIDMMTYFVKSYQYMKNRFKKLQLRGSSNKIYLETFDLLKLDEMIFNFVEVYDKVLDGLLFEIETSDHKISLKDIY